MSPKQLPKHGLYAITDGPRDDLVVAVTQALAGGARLLQYRDKESPEAQRLADVVALRQLCHAHEVPLIINGDIALAKAAGADGVHLGRGLEGISEARATLGSTAIIGVACGGSLELARSAADAGASYLSFGAFFPSPTKPWAALAPVDLLRQSAALGLPRVAIGGITPDNGQSLVDAGADFLAAISTLFRATDIRATAERYASLYSTNRNPD